MATWADDPDPATARFYLDWAEAERRVDQLRRHAGIWPGIIRLARGGCRLTYDPPIANVNELDSHGYVGRGR
jgi:hypothetical protein